MRVSAFLCDFASVREGMMTIVSAGVTRLTRPELPASMGTHLAVLVEVDSAERAFPHEIVATIVSPDGAQLAAINGAFQVNESVADPGEALFVQLPLDLRPISVTEYGLHEIRVTADSGEPLIVKFRVAGAGPTPGGLPTPGPKTRPH